jgi:hypothetical protein
MGRLLHVNDKYNSQIKKELPLDYEISRQTLTAPFVFILRACCLTLASAAWVTPQIIRPTSRCL